MLCLGSAGTCLQAPEEGEKLGELIGTGEEEVVVLTGSTELPTITGRLSCFSGGLVLRTRMFPPVVLDFRTHLQALWLQVGMQPLRPAD